MIAVLFFNVSYLALLLWWASGWRKLLSPGQKLQLMPAKVPFVSVVVAFRNEERNLSALLQSLQNQSWPSAGCEFIFVDDHSSDDSVRILMEVDDSRLHVVHLADDQHGKKAALHCGINRARGEWILTTDADCRLHADWISSMVNYGVELNAEMVCGLVASDTDGSFLFRFQSMEIAMLQVSGAGSLAGGFPLLNTGASLAFRKEAWVKVSGYSSHLSIASGDDTFLMLDFQKAFPGKVRPLIVAAAVARTVPLRSLMQVIQQRLRWMGKTRHYKPSFIHLSGSVIVLAAVTLIAYFFCTLSGHGYGLLLCALFLARLISEFHILRLWKIQSGQVFSFPESAMMSFLYPFFMLAIFMTGLFARGRWRGRDL